MAQDAEEFVVPAEAHSDDRKIEIDFDAEPWFAQASDGEIEALAKIGWGGDYEADRVADHFEGGATSRLFSCLALEPTMPDGDTVGYECHVESDAAAAWIRANRPALAAKLEAAGLIDAEEGPETPAP